MATVHIKIRHGFPSKEKVKAESLTVETRHGAVLPLSWQGAEWLYLDGTTEGKLLEVRMENREEIPMLHFADIWSVEGCFAAEDGSPVPALVKSFRAWDGSGKTSWSP